MRSSTLTDTEANNNNGSGLLSSSSQTRTSLTARSSSFHSTSNDSPPSPGSDLESNDPDVSNTSALLESSLARSSSSSSMVSSNLPSLVAVLGASLTTGATTYSFGLYGTTLQERLDLSPNQVDTISTAFFVAGTLSFLPGLAADRFGTRWGVMTGGSVGALSLALFYAVTQGYIVPLPTTATLVYDPLHYHDDDDPDHAMAAINHRRKLVLVTVLSCLGVVTWLCNSLVTGSVFRTVSFVCGPGSKGAAVGIAKGYVGLGAGVYVSIFECLPHQSTLDFLPLCSVLFLLAAVVPATLFLPPKQQPSASAASSSTNNGSSHPQRRFRDDTTPRQFHLLYVSLLTLGCVIAIQALEQLIDPDNDDDSSNNGKNDDAVPSALQDHDLFATTERLSEQERLQYQQDHTEHVSWSQARWGRALFLLTAWLGPIYALLVLPLRPSPRRDTDDRAQPESSLPSTDNNAEQPPPPREDESTKNNNPTSEQLHLSGTLPRRREEEEEEEVSLLTSTNPLNTTTNRLQRSSSSALEPVDNTRSENNASAATTALPQLTLWQMVQTPSAMLLLWTTTILVGAGTVETNNMGQMVKSLQFPEAVTPASLALFSVAQSGSRVLTGALSEFCLSSSSSSSSSGAKRSCCCCPRLARPFFLVLAACVAVVAHATLAVASVHQLWFVAGSTLAGFAFGMVWPLMVLIVGEVFGLAHVGANYLFFDGSASAGGTFLLSKVVAQAIYDRHEHDTEHELYSGVGSGVVKDTCVGRACFQDTHRIVAGLAGTCILTSLLLWYKTRPIYAMLQKRTASAAASSSSSPEPPPPPPPLPDDMEASPRPHHE